MKKVKEYNISTWPSLNVNYWGITKSGNTSVKLALIKKEHGKVRGEEKGVAQWVHRDNVTKYIDPDTALSNGNLNFTVIRNPYERALSMYKDFQKRNKIYMTVLDKRFSTVQSFDDFLKILKSQKDSERNEHFRTQVSFIYKNGKLPDRVFNLTEVNKVKNVIGIDIPHVNKIDKVLPLSESQIKLINEIYKRDFEILKFKMI